MDREFSMAASREGHLTRTCEAVYDEYDEISNMTVGTSSPFMQTDCKSPRSDTKSRMSIDPMTASFTSSAVPNHAEQPRQLTLNNQNLHGFARSVEAGAMPLRVDVIPDDAFVDYATQTPHTLAERELKKREDVSVLSVADRTADRCELGSDVADSTTLCSNGSQPVGDGLAEGNAWNIEKASVEAQIGSPTRRHKDPLNLANLDKHLQELSRGPAPLNVENIVVEDIPLAPQRLNISTTQRLPDAAAVSLLVEPSEGDAMSTSEVVSFMRNNSTKRSSAEDAMDDMWSTTSTHGLDTSYFGHGGVVNEKPHALSKENLRQLRHQLESGETPLRPEVLTGLGTVVRAMTLTNSTMSASTVVEPAMTEDRSKVVNTADCLGSPLGSFANGRNPANHALPRGKQERDASAMAGMSFHSMLVEGATTETDEIPAVESQIYAVENAQKVQEVGARVNGEDVDDEADDGDVVGHAEEVEGEEEDVDGLHGKSSTENDSRDGQNESVFNMTEDEVMDDVAEGGTHSRQMRELYRLVRESRQNQQVLRDILLQQQNIITKLLCSVETLESKISSLKGL